MKGFGIVWLAALLGAAWAGEADKEEGFKRLFDGKTLKGWRRRNKAGHGWGSVWTVTGGAIDGVQEWPEALGLLVCQHAFADFELRLEAKTDWPIDAGVLLRESRGAAYLVRIHCRDDGDVGGIGGHNLEGFGVAAKGWKATWKKDDWNELRIAIKGSPPQIRTWLNGKLMAELKDDAKAERLPARGRIVLRIAGGPDCFNDHACFRNLRIREAE